MTILSMIAFDRLYDTFENSEKIKNVLDNEHEYTRNRIK